MVDLASGESWRRLHEHASTKFVAPERFCPSGRMARLVAFLAESNGRLGAKQPRAISSPPPLEEIDPDGEDANLRLAARPVRGHLRLCSR